MLALHDPSEQLNGPSLIMDAFTLNTTKSVGFDAILPPNNLQIVTHGLHMIFRFLWQMDERLSLSLALV
jgi:hypothetical protein